MALSLSYFSPVDCIPNYGLTDITLPMHGYDVFHANKFNPNGDPGWRMGKIIHSDCWAPNPYYGYYYRDFLSIRPDYRCEAKLRSKIHRTLYEYAQESVSFVRDTLGISLTASLSLNVPAFAMDFETEAGFGITRSTKQTSGTRVLSENQGEVFTAEAECFTHDVTVARFNRVRFTPAFITALFAINKSVTVGTAQDQLDVYTAFVKEFGTHFARKTEMGASLLFEKVVYGHSGSRESAYERMSCLSNSAEVSLNAKAIIGGGVASASLKLELNTRFNSCSNITSSTSSSFEELHENINVVTKGSPPARTVEDWVDKDFSGVPIILEVEPISALFTDINLRQSESYGFPTSLNASVMKQFMEIHNRLYCTEVLRLTPAQCGTKMTGGVVFALRVWCKLS
jgi:hypothetical protein